MKKLLLFFTITFLSIYSLYAQQWYLSNTQQSSYIDEISVINDDVIWIKDSSDTSGFSISIDGGISWSHKNFPTLFSENSFGLGVLSAIDENTAYVIVSQSTDLNLIGLYKTVDAGNTWVKENGIFTASSFPDQVHFWDNNHGFAMGDGIELYVYLNGIWYDKSSDLGTTQGKWSLNSSSYLRIVGNSAYFLTNAGTILKSADRGLSWEEIKTPFTKFSNLSFDFKDESNGILVFNDNTNNEVYSTSDGGQNWISIGSNISNLFNNVKYIPSQSRYLSTSRFNSNLGLSYSDDNGLTWSRNTLFDSSYLGEIEYSINGKVFIGGYKLIFYQKSDFTYVPDNNFEQALIDLGYDDVLDDYVLTSNIVNVTELDVNGKDKDIELKISDLTGIEAFSALEHLDVWQNQLTSIDVSKNLNLTWFAFSVNQISSIDISNNIKLDTLACHTNQLSELNISKNTNLKLLAIQLNQLTSLDVSKNNALTWLKCFDNQLSCIQVNQGQLNNIPAGWYKDGVVIYALDCFGLNEGKTYVPDDNFEQALIDLGYDDVLDDYVITNNINKRTTLDLKSKNISDLTGIEDFVGLTELDCYDNKLEIIDISKNVLLTKLTVWKNQLKEIDVSKNLALAYLDCDENQFTSLDVSINSNLTNFFASSNQLVNLNVKNGNNSNFSNFYAIGNPMLYCIDVDNEVWSTANWTFIDSQTSFSENGCQDNGFMIEERDALIALYNATDGPNWTNNNNWNTIAPVGTWQGVTVDDNGHVTQLYFYNNNLEGTIPPEIGDFPYLKNLIIQSNPGFSGVIPSEIGQLTNLEYLSFYRNDLSGNIPTTITNLTKLSNLDLFFNNFSGQVPDLTQLSLLKRFSIGYNNFDFGDFENEFANYKGNIPDYFYAPMNKKDSEISYDIVVGNSYTMTMSNVSGTGVTYQWYKNDEPISGATSLTYTINKLQPTDIGDYTCKASSPIVTDLIIERETIHVYGVISEEDKNILIAIYDATNGDNWTSNSNWKTSAPIYEWFGVSVQGTRVSKIELSSNNLVGFIPKEIGLLPNLLNLSLEFNQLSGTIPAEIGNLTNLKELNLWTNQLSGTIPVEIGNLTKLELISLEANQLTGNIPSEFANLTAMKSFWVNENQLSGEVPDIFGHMPDLVYFSIYDNQFTGNVNLSNLNNLQRIYANNNQLSTLDARQNTALISLICTSNQLTRLDVTDNVNLEALYCHENQITRLDVTGNVNLRRLNISNNQLSEGLDISKNTNLSYFKALTNPELVCIQINQTQQNAIPIDWQKDDSASYSLDCSSFLDNDSDGVMNDVDNCPEVSNTDQADLDSDGIGDVCDPDIDGDGILNNDDNCLEVSNTDQSDIDSDGLGDVCDDDMDGDGILNTDDNCPEVSNSNQEDIDSDGIGNVCDEDIDNDGILNVDDKCPEFASSNQSDLDGDGIGDVCDNDIDGDGILNEADNCPEVSNSNQEDIDSDGIGDVCDEDIDGDGVANTDDQCSDTPSNVNVDATGCPIFTLPSNNFTLEATSETCPDKNNGQISISANETYDYTAEINGATHNFTNNSLTVSNMQPGTYEICITVSGETFEQCFNVTIKEGTTVSGKASVTSKKAAIKIEKGTAPYNVFINGQELFETNSLTFDLDVKHGDLVQVKTAKDCEGVFSKTINLFEKVTAYPNPTNGLFEIALPLLLKEVKIELFTTSSQLISSKTYSVVNGKVQLNIENMPAAVYFAKVHLENPVSVKIIKQ